MAGVFEEYTDKLVEYRQFKHELGLTDEEAASHPDTLTAFYELAQIVQKNPQIDEAYRAVLDPDNPDRNESIDLVRNLEIEIAEGELDSQSMSEVAYRRVARKLLTTAGIRAKAQEFLSVFGVDLHPPALPETGSQPESVVMDGEDFLAFLDCIQEQYYGGDYSVVDSITLAAQSAEVNFAEPKTAEEEFTSLANRVETEVSSFIESNSPLRLLELLDEVELVQIGEIYNPNNLLAFAKELAGRVEDEGLSSEQVDMLYRYKRVIRQLAGRRESIAIAKAESTRNQPVRRDGARTWAGDIHPYGHIIGGVIDLTESRDFSGLEDADLERKELIVDGVTVKLRQKHGS